MRCKLDAAGSVANHSNLLIFGIERRVPIRGMSEEALEVVEARIVWKFPCIETPNRWQYEIGTLNRNRVVCQVSNRNVPTFGSLIPLEPFDAM